MLKRINITKLWDEVANNDLLFVGSPKGVGFTTFISEWAAEQMFMQENLSILILTATRKAQVGIRFKILNNYKYYMKEGLGIDDNVLFNKKPNGCVTGIFCYEDIDLYGLDEFYDVIIIDSDDFSDRLYNNLDTLMANTGKLVFNTYDVPQSIFYKIPDENKVVLTSDYNKALKKKLRNTYSETVNFDRILDGKFTEY
jgi:hypothetical protein